ncbi:MAG TPA: ATP-binding protein [Acidimicrobiales bacterium]|nr:ATP-binding protein [Acidimicrobiales bacterium]
MRLEIRLVLPADARLLPSTRMAMLAHLRALGVDEDCCDDVILALDEACANVVRHAFPGALAAEYTLAALLTADEAVIVVEDLGKGIDPEILRRSRAGADPEATSGRGLYLMRQLMSSVEIEPVAGASGTRVRMRKKLRPAAPSASVVTGARSEGGLVGTRPPAAWHRDAMF